MVGSNSQISSDLKYSAISRFGGFRPVGGMDQVHLPAGAEVAANRAGRRFQTAGGSKHVADDANTLQAFDNRGHDRTAGNELLQSRIPALFHVLCIVLLG